MSSLTNEIDNLSMMCRSKLHHPSKLNNAHLLTINKLSIWVCPKITTIVNNEVVTKSG